MIRLNSSSKLQVQLSGAITTNQSVLVVSYFDTAIANGVITGGSQQSTTNGASLVDICDAPASGYTRDIDYINFYNADTVTSTPSLIYNNGSTSRNLIKAALLTLEQLNFTHGTGWCALDANGNRKEVTSSNFGAITATSITDSGLTSGRMVLAGTGGLLTDSSAITYSAGVISATGFTGALNGSLGATTPSTVAGTTLTTSGATTVVTGGGQFGVGAVPENNAGIAYQIDTKANPSSTQLARFRTSDYVRNTSGTTLNLYTASATGNSRVTIQPTYTGNSVTGELELLASTTTTGLLTTTASATGSAGFNLPHGAAPSSPVNGDMWTTTAGLFVRINGVTKTVTLT